MKYLFSLLLLLTTYLAYTQVEAGISAGLNHSLFLKTDGTVWATGDNSFGKLGDGTLNNTRSPIQVMANVKVIVAGESISLFLKTDGTVWASGNNYSGKLGDGTTTNRINPVQVMTNVKDIAAGNDHSLFLKTDGTVWATGDNSSGQLGDGTKTSRKSPVQVMTNVKAIAAKMYYSLFLKTDGTVWATGDNSFGMLGDGTTYGKYNPVQVATNVNAISAGGTHSLFLKTDGTVWSTGRNDNGQLGDGTKTDKSNPLQVTTGVKAIAAGNYHSLFLKTDGTIWATGRNDNGQLGDKTNTDKSSPVQVATEANSISAGAKYSLFIKTDDTVWATGYNDYGQLGNGTSDDKKTWIQVFNTKAACTSCSDANFSYTPTNPQVNQSITFKDESIGSPTSWAWDFGDGTTSTLQNPSKTYTKAGDYVVKLTISKTGSTAQSISKTTSIVAPTLSLSATAQNASATASTGVLTLNTNNTWTASSNATWLKVSPTSGNSGTNIAISFTVDANTTTSTRSGIITFSAGTLTQTFTITQAGAVVNTLTLSANAQNVVATSSTGGLTLNTNNSWTASSNATWLKVSPTSGNAGTNVTIGFTVDINPTTATRSGIITFSAGGLTQTFTIIQAALITAIEENEPSQYTLQLYPNPSKETVTVELKSPKLQKAIITIHNLQGKKIEEMAYKMTQNTEKVLVDVGQLPSGTYIVKAAFEDGQKIAMKLLIEK